MRFKSFKTGKSDEDKEPEVAKKVSLNDVVGMEKKISDKTKELKDTAQQIKDLSDTTPTIDDEDEIPGPHGPLIELTIESGDDLTDLDTEAELSNLMDLNENEGEEEIKVVEVIDKKAIKTTSKDEKAEEPENEEEAGLDLSVKDEDDSFNNLFTNEEEEANPLANLINNLPEVSAQELINELEEIKEIIKERQQG